MEPMEAAIWGAETGVEAVVKRDEMTECRRLHSIIWLID
jgi:hypothetical protein